MSSNSKFCADCGRQNDPDAVFCASCGMKFAVPQSRIGDNDDQQNRIEPMSEPQQYQPRSQTSDVDFSKTQATGEINGLVDGSAKMLTDPQGYSLRLLADPDAPSATPLIFIKVMLTAVMWYLIVSKDEYFNDQLLEAVQSQAEGSNITVNEFREVLQYFYPVFFIVLFLLLWYIGSSILAMIIKGGIQNNSPLKVDTGRAMRQLNAYRQIPLIIAHLFGITIILISDPGTYTYLFQDILQPISWIFYAIILWRGLGEHVGYHGSIHKYIAGAIIGFSALSLFGTLA